MAVSKHAFGLTPASSFVRENNMSKRFESEGHELLAFAEYLRSSRSHVQCRKRVECSHLRSFLVPIHFTVE